MDWLSHLADAPFANILFLAGLAFLAVGVLGKIAGKIEPDKIGRVASAVVGIALICVGLYLHVSGDQQKDLQKQANSSNSASPSPTPDAGHGQNVTVGPPVNAPVHRTPTNDVNRRPPDQGESVARREGQDQPVKFTPGERIPLPKNGSNGTDYQNSPPVPPMNVSNGANYQSSPPVPPKISRTPDTCKQGFVWREAVPNDHVCVTPLVRKVTVVQNLQAARRRNPGGGPYGVDTCLNGYVWREALPIDHVCVTPQDRQQAALDNAQAPFRRE